MSKFASIVLATLSFTLTGCIEKSAHETGVVSDSFVQRIVVNELQTKKDVWLICLDGISYLRYSTSITAKIDPATKLPESCADSISLNKKYFAKLNGN